MTKTTAPAETFHKEPLQPLASPLGKAVRKAPVACSASTPLKEALRAMQQADVGSMLVTAEGGRLVGIFTLRDLLSRVALEERSLTEPIANVMTADPITLPATAFAFEAALAMTRHGVHHIVVMDGERIAGVVSEKDLFTLQRVGLKTLSDALRAADSVNKLAELAADIRGLAQNLIAQGVAAEHLTQIISSLNDLLTARIIDLEVAASGLTDRDWCWIALGSEGRHEQTLATDQDNGIVFADPVDTATDERRVRLLPVAQAINRSLDACGFPLCKGNIMAGNREWCLSLGEWRRRFADWIDRGNPQALLNAAIFFDFRPLAGQAALAEELRAWLKQAARENPRFLHQMAENALRNRPPLGLIRDFVTSDDGSHGNAIDLKMGGSSLFIDAARILALAQGSVQTNSAARLREAGAALGIAAQETEAWIESLHFIQLLRLRHQQAQMANAQTPDNCVDPHQLHALDRRTLKEALRQARALQTRLAMDYQV